MIDGSPLLFADADCAHICCAFFLHLLCGRLVGRGGREEGRNGGGGAREERRRKRRSEALRTRGEGRREKGEGEGKGEGERREKEAREPYRLQPRGQN